MDINRTTQTTRRRFDYRIIGTQMQSSFESWEDSPDGHLAHAKLDRSRIVRKPLKLRQLSSLNIVEKSIAVATGLEHKELHPH